MVRRTTVAVSGVYAAVLYLAGVKLDHDLKKALAYLPSAAVLLVVIFDRWLWKVPRIFKFHRRPVLGGTWRVELRPDKDSLIPPGGNWGPIEGYLVIEQTYWSIAIRQYTAESASESRATSWLTKTEASPVVLNFTYDNVPKREHIARSQRHVGACELRTAPGRPSTLEGVYFTDRFTAGDMSCALVSDNTSAASFAEARGLA